MRERTLAAFGLLGVVALLLSTASLLFVLARPTQAPPAAPAPPCLAPGASVDAGASAPSSAESAWRPAPAALAKAADVAFALGATLSTDGKQASYEPGDGTVRAVEVPAAIPRVFSASGRLFAIGVNAGAPFAIVFAPDEEAQVVPLPCSPTRLAGGESGVIAGVCAEGTGLSMSWDWGRSFRAVSVGLPAPPDALDGSLEQRLEAVAVSPAGAVLIASAQRWRSESSGGVLSWTWGQVTWRPAGSRALRTSNVQALAHTVGVHLAGGAATLAGLEVALDGAGEGQVRPRLFRGAEGEPLVAAGIAGPACGTSATAAEVEGVLLGTEVALFACGDRLVTTLDGGASWSVERALGEVRLLRGGDMRLFARAGERAWERRFVDRAESGATAVRVPGAKRVRKEAVDAGPVGAAFDIREPHDGGIADADVEVDSDAAAGASAATP